MAKSTNKMNFEESMQRLENIVKEVENKALPLDQIVALFEEGYELSKFCHQKLNDWEKRIEILTDEQKNGQWANFETTVKSPERQQGDDLL